MQLAILDWETYYDDDYRLSKLTTEEYVRDPRFETIGVGVDFAGVQRWLEHDEFKQFVAAQDWSQIAVAAHHAHFDGLILSHHYGTVPAFYYDTLSMGRARHQTYSGASLDNLLALYGFEPKATPPDVKGYHRKDMSQALWQEYGRYCKHDVGDCKKLLHRMAVVEKYPVAELRLIDLTIRMFTQPVFRLDEGLMREYLEYEKERKDALLLQAGVTVEELRSGDKFAAILRDLGVEPGLKAGKPNLDGSEKLIYAFAKTDSFMQEILEDSDEDVRILAEARVGARSTINESRGARLLRLGAGGRPMPVYLKYGEAHTFRWAGADKLNWQNFEQLIKGQPRKGTIRRAIIAPPGESVVAADSSTIEARMTAWLAQDSELLKAFANNEDVYSQYASKYIYGRPVDRRKVEADYIPGQVGKECILGMGFGMGWYKCAFEFLKGKRGAPPIIFTAKDIKTMNIDPSVFLTNVQKVRYAREMPSRLSEQDKLVHCLVSDHLINLYRASRREITDLWKFHDTVLNWVYTGKKTSFGHLGVFRTVHEGIMLPSGLVLHLTGLRKNDDGEFIYQLRPGVWVKIYGAKLTENLVQALARIVVAGQMLTLAKTMHIALMEHDKIVTCVPTEQAAAALAEMIAVMRVPPQWGHFLPLNAEGGFGRSFGEAK